MKCILVFIIVILLPSCSKQAQSSYSDQTMRLLYADPEIDFRSAIREKDYRFMGVYGYSIMVPGVSMKCLDFEKDINPIVGTSDATGSYEMELFNTIAHVYAKNYNFKMKFYLKENKDFECNS